MTAAPDHASVTTRFAQAILEAAQRHGADVPAPLREAVAHRARMQAAQQDALWTLFADASTDPLAGLRLGAGLQAGHLDIVGMLLLSCDSLGDALEVLTEYAPIIGDNARFEAERLSGEVVLHYLPDYQAWRDFRVEAALACVLNLARWMTNGRFQPRAVRFAHAARAPVADYEAVLGCPVEFGHSASAVAMDEDVLALELVHAGARLHAHLRMLADDMLAALPSGSVSARTQQWIRLHPRWGKDRIGEQLGMSGRHLNRKLAEEGISFKSLREALLHEMAVQALRAGQPVAAVGERLGFSDESAFSRAFRRWSGQTPAQFARAGA
ncbi:MAG: AraC family transcriptional regulator [Pseudomonadota bacterium]